MSLLLSSKIILYIWPGRWNLPSFDPNCLAAVLYLQLAIPGKFCVSECSNPDSSPTGQLPYLVHDQHVVTTFAAIVKYIASLRTAENATYPDANLDIHLSPLEKSQRTAWLAHAESHLGDLLHYTLYAATENWVKLVQPTLSEMYAIPQKYYVPRRIRDSHFERLNASGLWSRVVTEDTMEKPFTRNEAGVPKKRPLTGNVEITQAFETQKVLEKGRAEFDLYDELLQSKLYLFQNQISSLDILIAAHLLLLLRPAFPDKTLQSLIRESYPSLASYAERVYSSAFSGNVPTPTIFQPTSSLWTLIPSWSSVISRPKSKAKSPEEVHYDRLRLGFFGAVLGVFTTYLMVMNRRYRLVIASPAERRQRKQEIDQEDDSSDI